MRKYRQEIIPTVKFPQSWSAATAPIRFVQMKATALKLCIDYRALNCITIPNIYRLPLISEFLKKIRGRKWFTRLDLKNEYNLIMMATGDKWKTGLCIKQGLFEYTVMPLGVTNASASCQEMMDTLF